MPEPKCLRCNIELKTLGKETIQLGEYAPFFGHLSNLASGGLDVILRSCLICGELSFFQPTEQDTENSALTKVCPHCGHHCHAAKQSCPACGYEFY